jgi:hypothetical protein
MYAEINRRIILEVHRGRRFSSGIYLRLKYETWDNVPVSILQGQVVAQLIETLCYEPEGRGFYSRCCYWIFLLT